MLAAPSRDWNVFQQIFAEHWAGFTRAHPRYQTSYYNDLVAKMLACGNPEKMGYLEGSCWISGSWICRGHPIALLSLFPPSCPYFSKAFLRPLHFRDNVGA
jgi:hypothetical protein